MNKRIRFHASQIRPARTAALLAALLAAPALARQGGPAETAAGDASAARQALSSAPTLEPADERAPGDLVAGGPVRFVPLGSPSDASPLPIPRQARDGAEGDELLAGPAGNPFFLGFAAGEYAPAEHERIDPLLAAARQSLAGAPRPHQDTFGFVMLAARISAERVAELEGLGVRVLGYHPHNCLAVAFPEAAIPAVAGLEFVRWIGVARPWQKRHPMLETVLQRDAAESVEVYISVFESDLGPDSTRVAFGSAQLHSPTGIEPAPAQLVADAGRWRSNGWQQAALEALGVEIDLFSPRSNSFRARLPRTQLDAVTALDFVQFVEPWIAPTMAHDESTPLINADLTRVSWNGGASNSVVVGEADGGIDTGHTGLNHIYGWGWDLAGSGTGPWHDGHGHGSHVAGTIFGKADADRSLDGVAPGLGGSSSLRIFNTKIFNDFGSWGGATMSDILDRFSADLTDPNGNTTPKPHVVNHSWGTPGTGWIGTEVDCRELDADIWTYHQMHVFAAGNEGSSVGSVRREAVAKNVFTVGNVLDYHDAPVGYPGTRWTSSSRGPTGDLRWKPNVAAPGHSIDSVQANSGSGYVEKGGTSMAAPHVTGLAAQLMDHFSFLRYRPATLGAVLMATALTRNGVTLSFPSTSGSGHHNMYGAGRVEAFKAHNLGGQGLYFWNFTMNSSSGHAELDFPIATGATRVSFVMLYHERAASSGASTALVNDLDMYIDRWPFTVAGNSGDYFSHQSSRDNAETRILDDPQVGDWRIKIYPESIPATFGNTVRVGVAVAVTYGDLTPAATLSTSVDDSYVKPNEVVQFTGTVSNPSYVASAVHLAASLGSGATLVSSETTLKDGHVSNQMDNPADGHAVTLGNIRYGQDRSVRWRARWSTEGAKTLWASMGSENAGSPISNKVVVVDGTPPGGPTNLSSSHPVGSSRCETQVVMNWTAATDNLSGVAGYRVLFDTNALTILPQTQNLGPVTSYSQNLAPSPNFYYFHIRAVDRSGNWGATQHYGPFRIVPGGAYSYCTGAPNSVGSGATIGSNGNVSIGANALLLGAFGLPSGQPSLYFAGTSAISVPFGNGIRCAGGLVVRLGVVSTGPGNNTLAVNLGAGSPLGSIAPGQSRYFQNWYRDPLAGGAGYNLTNGLHIVFCD